jgi:hypothetical protein
VLFLINGLDECDGNHNDLLDELQGMQFGQRNKICLSSRPEEALRRRLEPLPSVPLQDLNYEDILNYAHKKLKLGGNPELKLASRVAEDVEGVFLWAVLVCDSLSSGIIAKDDEEIMLRRLHAYPRGLDELFHRMFSNIEEIHYKSLALYFYAARQSSFSVAMAVASQHSREVMSVDRFGELCELETTRITVQSKGLLEIDDRRVHVWDQGWSLRDISNNHIRKDRLDDSDLQLFKKYACMNIAFVHRSAHDYIFDIVSNERPAWLRPVEGPEMVHKILDGALWLAQCHPVVVVSRPTIRSHNGFQTTFAIKPQFQAIATDDFSKLDQERLYEGLDKHLDTVHTWASIQRSDPTGTLSKCMVRGRPAALTQRTNFWHTIINFEPRFFTSRLHRFWDCDDAYLETIALLNAMDPDRYDLPSSPTEIYRAMRSALTEFRPQGIANSSITDFPYAGERRYCSSAPYMQIVYSWLGTSISHELLIAQHLYNAAIETSRYNISGLESHELACVLSDIIMRVQTISDSWKLFIGDLASTPRGSRPSPLQLSLPLWCANGVNIDCLADDEPTMNKRLSCRPGMTLRLSCFAKHGPDRHVEHEAQTIPTTNSFDTATYHLGPETTALVVGHITEDEKGIMMTKFVGTTAERSACIGMILTDIWDDVDGQLTAWEQLYVRACVKCYFAWCWEEEEYSANIWDLNRKE